VNDIQQKIKEAKLRYQQGLANLEKISLEIHEQRKVASLKCKVVERVDGEGREIIEDGLVAMANQFDLKGPKTYGNVMVEALGSKPISDTLMQIGTTWGVPICIVYHFLVLSPFL